MDIKLTELVKNNWATFDSYRAGFFYYNVTHNTGKFHTVGFMGDAEMDVEEQHVYQFTIPVEDIGGATLLKCDKAITLMRWIRKAIDNNTLIRIDGFK